MGARTLNIDRNTASLVNYYFTCLDILKKRNFCQCPELPVVRPMLLKFFLVTPVVLKHHDAQYEE